VSETCALLDGPHASLAQGLADGRYTLWLGSGISLDRVDGLKGIIKRLLVWMHGRWDQANPTCTFGAAMAEAVAIAELSALEQATFELAEPPTSWPALGTILDRLAGRYAKLLDIRIEGEADDYLLWEGVDILATFPPGLEPDAEHLSIALLALEGALPAVASANWDGLIESAFDEVSPGAPELAVVVLPEDLRRPARPTQLIKFHGCAVLAGQDPPTYREWLVARHTQISQWTHSTKHEAIRTKLQLLAATTPTLMVGLSGQDEDIQSVFQGARGSIVWSWPCDPPAQVFAGSALGVTQLEILKIVYARHYSGATAEIRGSALVPAYAKPLLTALMLHVTTSKLIALLSGCSTAWLDAPAIDRLASGLRTLRDLVAASADGDRLLFVRCWISTSSAMLRAFRTGAAGPADARYEPLNVQPASEQLHDPVLRGSGLPEIAMALASLGLGLKAGDWQLSVTALAPGDDVSPILLESSAGHRRLLPVSSDETALALQMSGVGRGHDVVYLNTGGRVRPLTRSPMGRIGRTGRSSGPRIVYVREVIRRAADVHAFHNEMRRAVVA